MLLLGLACCVVLSSSFLKDGLATICGRRWRCELRKCDSSASERSKGSSGKRSAQVESLRETKSCQANETVLLRVYSKCLPTQRTLCWGEIADNLHRSGIIVTKQSVNSVLYFELTNGKCVAQDDSYHWTATGQVYSSSRSSSRTDMDDVQGMPIAEALIETASVPMECRTARRVIQILRSGTTLCCSAKAISVGTAAYRKGTLFADRVTF